MYERHGNPDWTVGFLDARTGKERQRIELGGGHVVVWVCWPNGEEYANVGSTISLLHPGEVRKDRQLRGPGNLPHHTTLTLTADGRLFATARTHGRLSRSIRSTVSVWEVASENLVRSIGDLEGKVTALALSSNGRLLAAGDATAAYGSGTSARARSWLAFGGTAGRSSPWPSPATGGCWPRAAGTAASCSGTFLARPGARAGKAQRLGEDELRRMWRQLTTEDAATAYAAVGKLAAAHDQSVSFLDKEAVLPVADPKRLEGLVAQLDDRRFATRNDAAHELVGLGAAAVEPLRRRLQRDPSTISRRGQYRPRRHPVPGAGTDRAAAALVPPGRRARGRRFRGGPPLAGCVVQTPPAGRDPARGGEIALARLEKRLP